MRSSELLQSKFTVFEHAVHEQVMLWMNTHNRGTIREYSGLFDPVSSNYQRPHPTLEDLKTLYAQYWSEYLGEEQCPEVERKIEN